MHFTDNDGYHNFLFLAPMLSSLTLDSNKKVTNWILTEIPPDKIKPFDTDLEPTISNLANGRVILKFSHFVFVKKIFSLFYSNFNLNLYIVYELNNGSRNLTNKLTLKIAPLVQSN